jgi:hypothetical protein
MTELYWQQYLEKISLQPLERKDKFWTGMKTKMNTYYKHPKHYL